jgi:hypothetical protein
MWCDAAWMLVWNPVVPMRDVTHRPLSAIHHLRVIGGIYLARADADRYGLVYRPRELVVLKERHTIRDGVIVGLIGYAAVALFYSAFDFLASRGTLYTVNLLGKAVFRGLRDPSVLMFPLDLDTGAILRYNALHLVVALIIGIVVTSLIATAERNPSRRGIVRLLIVSGLVLTVVIVAALTTPIRPLLPVWSIVAANILAMVLAGGYLVWRRPGLWNRLALAS